MSYKSVDVIQKALAEEVFGSRADTKKAAGRALGTIVELMSFYVLQAWGFRQNLSIERGLAEFANDSITHNVEFGLHPEIESWEILVPPEQGLPLSVSKLRKFSTKPIDKTDWNPPQLLSSKRVLRNCCTIEKSDDDFLVANLEEFCERRGSKIKIVRLSEQPFAMVECKRVGIEEGAKKGPTTIEKAKQGAYVAKHVSSLQKIRGADGKIYGAMPLQTDGKFEIRPFAEELTRLVYEVPLDQLNGFILTLGVVSNHGNWFTAENMNKELLVLKDSYDWLLFLTDDAIGEFVSDVILSSNPETSSVRKAFEDTYDKDRTGSTRFTKVLIDYDAHMALTKYFSDHIKRIEETWFNILSPECTNIHELKKQLSALSSKTHG